MHKNVSAWTKVEILLNICYTSHKIRFEISFRPVKEATSVKRYGCLALLLALLLLLGACGPAADGAGSSAPPSDAGAGQQSPEGGDAPFKTAIMVPGIVGENPIFQMYVGGIQRACSELGLPEPNIVEGGDDWGAYSRLLASFADSGEYEVIITFTDSMCDTIKVWSGKYPEQKYILIDGDLEDYMGTIPDNVYSMRNRDDELGYMGGYFCGLVTKSNMERANPDLTVGLVFTDEYEPWEKDIKPTFTNGARAVDPNIEVINVVVGDWVDPVKGAEVTRALFARGVDIVWYTTGASTYGCVTEAAAQKKYAVASDNNSIALDPDTIVGCTMIQGEPIAYDIMMRAAQGELSYGTADVFGAAEGTITFTFDDPVYLEKVPQDIRDAMAAMYADLAAGKIDPFQAPAA